MAASTGNTLIARRNRFRVHSLAGCGCRIGFTTRLGYVLFRSATQRPVPRSPNVPACPLPTGSTRARCGPARLVPSRPNGRRRARGLGIRTNSADAPRPPRLIGYGSIPPRLALLGLMTG